MCQHLAVRRHARGRHRRQQAALEPTWGEAEKGDKYGVCVSAECSGASLLQLWPRHEVIMQALVTSPGDEGDIVIPTHRGAGLIPPGRGQRGSAVHLSLTAAPPKQVKHSSPVKVTHPCAGLIPPGRGRRGSAAPRPCRPAPRPPSCCQSQTTRPWCPRPVGKTR